MTLTSEGIPTDPIRPLRSIVADLRRMGDNGDQLYSYLPDAHNIGSGIDRTAYRVGDYVFKRTSTFRPRNASNALKALMRESGIKRPRQWFVNGWVVQPYYRPMDWRQSSPDPNRWSEVQRRNQVAQRKHPTAALDLHGGNVGYSPAGDLFMFDW